ncbi:hypothetical protein GJ496_000354 [Pomphorhynchus laevis]|nr:hypothetical protein GJ496_000354 [Pomphorhynchus laevis]
MESLKVDFASFTGHKFYAPKGVGACIFKGEVAKNLLSKYPLLHGGNQQSGLRSGTECLPLISGLAEAISLIKNESNLADIESERNRLEQALLDRSKRKGAKVIGSDMSRLPNTSLILGVIDLIDDNVLITRGCGAACHSSSKCPSNVLKAMQLQDNILVQDGDIVRISLGRYTTGYEIDKIINSLKD